MERYVHRMAQSPCTLRRWTRTEYERVASLGVFDNEHLELVGGDLIVAALPLDPDRRQRPASLTWPSASPRLAIIAAPGGAAHETRARCRTAPRPHRRALPNSRDERAAEDARRHRLRRPLVR